MAVEIKAPPKHAARTRNRRFVPQFRMKTFVFVILVAAAFFAGRATRQNYVSQAKANAAVAAKLFQGMQGFRDNLKPLQLPPGVTTGTKPPGQLRLMSGPRSRSTGFLISRDFFHVDVSRADFSGVYDCSRAARVRKIVNDLTCQVRDQAHGNPCGEFWATPPLPGCLSATATLVFPYGTVQVTGCYVSVEREKEALVKDEMTIHILTCLRVDDTGKSVERRGAGAKPSIVN